MIKSMIMVNYAPFYLITDPGSLWKVLFYMHDFTYLTGFYVSGTTFVRKVCMEFENICKPVFCEHNVPVEATYSTFMCQNLE